MCNLHNNVILSEAKNLSRKTRTKPWPPIKKIMPPPRRTIIGRLGLSISNDQICNKKLLISNLLGHHHPYARHHGNEETQQCPRKNILRLIRLRISETDYRLCRNQQSQRIISLQTDKNQYQPTLNRANQCPGVEPAIFLLRHIHTIMLQNQLDKDIGRFPAYQDSNSYGNPPNLKAKRNVPFIHGTPQPSYSSKHEQMQQLIQRKPSHILFSIRLPDINAQMQAPDNQCAPPKPQVKGYEPR